MIFSGFGIKKPVITITGFFTFFYFFFWPLLYVRSSKGRYRKYIHFYTVVTIFFANKVLQSDIYS